MVGGQGRGELGNEGGGRELQGEMLTAMLRGVPASSQARACRHAWSMTHRPTGWMSPVLSSRGTNSAGETAPSSGSCQLSRASTAVQCLVFRSSWGW